MPSQQASKKPMKAQRLDKKNNQAREPIVILPNYVLSNSTVNNKPEKINYAFGTSPFGRFLVAATEIGVCQLDFIDNNDVSYVIAKLGQAWPKAELINQPPQHLDIIESAFHSTRALTEQLPLHLSGTEFQLKVWRALLSIPCGSLSTYAEVAGKIKQAKASRAVGTAIGANPVAFFVPCHRVIRNNGSLGGYRWGIERKQAVIDWERNF